MSVFSAAEHARRRRAVLDAAPADALLVTCPQHLVYLLGDTTGTLRAASVLSLAALILTPKTSVLVVRQYAADGVLPVLAVDRVVPYFGDGETPAEVVVRELAALSLERATVALSADRGGLTADDLLAIRRGLPSLTVASATAALEGCADIKSPEELEAMRAAMRFTQLALDAFARHARVGATEAEVAAEMVAAMLRGGSELPYYDPGVLVGERSALPHALASQRPIRAGDVVFVEVSGACEHYHAPLVRTAVAGANDEARRLYEVARAAQEAAIATIGPGARSGEVDAACRDVVRRAGREETFRHRTGYSVGIDWVTSGGTSLLPGGERELVPGMVFHLPTNLFVAGRFAVGCSHTVVVTPAGHELLSDRSLELLEVAS